MILDTALQEWQLVCQALASGACSVLLRKGGIHDHKGAFELKHRSFVLLPSHLHQSPERLRHASQPSGELAAEHRIELWAQVSRIMQITDLALLQVAGQRFQWPWSDEEIAKRFNYREQPHLFLVLLRCYRLEKAVLIPDEAAYAGCKSWIPLQQPIDCGVSHAVLDDEQWQYQQDEICQLFHVEDNA